VSVAAREMIRVFGPLCSTDRVKAYFGTNRTDTVSIRSYQCSNLTNIGGLLQRIDSVRILVFDTAQDTIIHRCVAVLTIQAGTSCRNAVNTITARIHNADGMPVPGYNLTALMDQHDNIKTETDREGEAKIKVPQSQGTEIMPYKNDDFLNGVNTLDLLQIQRHILGIYAFQSPYQFLAADANADQRISVSDLNVLRDLILGKTSTLPDQTSWLAVPDYFTFKSPRTALTEEYPKSYALGAVKTDLQIGFVGVKVGDVDQSYTSRAANFGVQQRNASDFIAVMDQNVVKDQIVDLMLPMERISGGEFVFDLEGLELLTVPSQKWYRHTGGSTTKIIAYEKGLDQTLHLRLQSKKEGKLREMLKLKVGTVYDENLVKNSVDLAWRSLDNKTTVTVSPNPSYDKTTIKLSSEVDYIGNLWIYDQMGRLVLDRKVKLEKGDNELVVQRAELKGTGVYHVRINVDQNSYTAKIIFLE
jgi:hypothetical protein